jgi:predicted enzyme related to lactoylglutathione lyase
MAHTQPGFFIWYELLVQDPQAAIEFYSDVFGWKTEAFDENYTLWIGSQGPIGGVLKSQEGVPPHWLGNVQVEDVDATLARAGQLGGKPLFGPIDVPNVGRYAALADPQGAAFAIFQPSRPLEAHDLARAGEIQWNELFATDATAALSFYAELFGWKVGQEHVLGAEGVYRVFGIGDAHIGGIFNAPAGAPTAWLFYVGTDDLTATVERAASRGAKVVHGPIDVPGGGRIVQLLDPQGAAFALHYFPSRA